MQRYGVIRRKNPREIVLLKGRPCAWGRCAFCDYIADNCADEESNFCVNTQALARVTGMYGALEVINSGSVFELDAASLAAVRDTAAKRNIQKLYFECHYLYRQRLNEMEEYFGVKPVFKCGIETFDDDFRNRVLKKGIVFSSPREVASYFPSVCILVGVAGQTREMIARDVEILTEYFEYGCINVYCNNSTPLVRDEALVRWFSDTYGYLASRPNIDVLYCNTDFGVGEVTP